MITTHFNLYKANEVLQHSVTVKSDEKLLKVKSYRECKMFLV